jgi:transcriptional regulator with XRE-family HTH domain
MSCRRARRSTSTGSTVSEIARRFAENLVRCRKRARFSQEALGLRASLHRTEISLLERGNRIPRVDTLVKLSGALGIPPGDLLAGIVWKPGETTRGRFIEMAVPGLGLVSRRFEVERHGGGDG